MAKFYISSGDLKYIADKPTAKEAAIEAFSTLEENPVQKLGHVTVISELGFDSSSGDDLLYWTLNLLDEAGQLDQYLSAEWLKEEGEADDF